MLDDRKGDKRRSNKFLYPYIYMEVTGNFTDPSKQSLDQRVAEYGPGCSTFRKVIISIYYIIYKMECMVKRL